VAGATGAAAQTGSAALCSPRETDLGAAAAASRGLKPQAASLKPQALPGLLRGDLTPLCLWGVMCVLLCESWLFHRRAVY
jgi:hypothetical protein